jgi:hypothetical protein
MEGNFAQVEKSDRTINDGSSWRHLVVHLLELQIPMGAGALLCLLVGRLVGTSEYAAVYYPGSALFAIGDLLFLTVPAVAWMILRGRNRRLNLELSLAMMTPVALVVVVGELVGLHYLGWLVAGMYPAMTVGIVAYMLYRRNEFEIGWTWR